MRNNYLNLLKILFILFLLNCTLTAVYAQSQNLGQCNIPVVTIDKNTLLHQVPWEFKIGTPQQMQNNPNFFTQGWQEARIGEFIEKQGLVDEDYDGFYWYRLCFQISEDMDGKDLLLQLGIIDDSDCTFVDGNLVECNGGFPPNYYGAWDKYRHYIITPHHFNANQSVHQLIIMGYDADGYAGIWGNEEYTLSPYEEHFFSYFYYVFINKYLDPIISFLILLFFCYHIYLFAINRLHREHLVFSIICLSFSVSLFLHIDLIKMIFGGYGWRLRTEYIFLIIASHSTFAFVLFYVLKYSWRNALQMINIILGISYMVLLAFWPEKEIYSFINFYWGPLGILLVLLGFSLLIHQIFMKKKYPSVIVTLGMSIMAGFVLYDLITGFLSIQIKSVFPYGFAFAIFFFNMDLISQWNKISKKYEELSKSLEVEIKRRTHQLEVQREKAMRDNEFKTHIISAVSHDFKNPIHTILGYIELIISKPIVQENEDIQRNLKVIFNNISRLQELVETLLSYSRLESGRFTINPQVVSIDQLKAFVRDLGTSLRTGTELNLNVINHFESDTLYIDFEKLKQISTNIITNAFKFTESGTIHIVFEGNKDSYFQLIVKDTGIGIPKDKQGIIFNEYQRIENKRNGKDIPGTGLGLYIVKRLVHTLGGNIRLDSEIDRGSTFYITIPLSSPAATKTG